jgi:hypothetical protein
MTATRWPAGRPGGRHNLAPPYLGGFGRLPRPRCLLPALAAWIRLVDVLRPVPLQVACRRAIELAVVTLAQPPVQQDGNASAGERDGRGLRGPGEIRAEDSRDAVVCAPPAQLSGLLATDFGQSARQPAGGNAVLVVLGRRVRLEHDADGHRTSAGSSLVVPNRD